MSFFDCLVGPVVQEMTSQDKTRQDTCIFQAAIANHLYQSGILYLASRRSSLQRCTVSCTYGDSVYQTLCSYLFKYLMYIPSQLVKAKLLLVLTSNLHLIE